MGVYQRSFGYTPGRYWIEELVPICDGGGVVDEKWSEPQPATFTEECYVVLDGHEHPTPFEWRVVKAGEPVPEKAAP